MFGGHGRLFRVALSEGRVEDEEIPQDLFGKFLNGAGLATHYLFREVPRGPGQGVPAEARGVVPASSGQGLMCSDTRVTQSGIRDPE